MVRFILKGEREVYSIFLRKLEKELNSSMSFDNISVLAWLRSSQKLAIKIIYTMNSNLLVGMSD